MNKIIVLNVGFLHRANIVFASIIPLFFTLNGFAVDKKKECQEFRSNLPKTMFQKFIEVPEDWDQPKGKKIKVFFYGRIPSHLSDIKQIPVVFFNGGPGLSSHSSYQILDSTEFEDLNSKLAFIYLDQRGTGCSDPYPDELTPENTKRLTLYGSRNIVRDAEAIRTQLFGHGSKWKVFGQSYGGMIVHRYVQMSPGSILGAYAHGFALLNDPYQLYKRRIEAQGRVSNDYFKIYPNDKTRILAIRDAIPIDHCFTDGKSRICGPSLIDGISALLGFRESWEELHDTIEALFESLQVQENFKKVLVEWANENVFSMFSENAFLSGVVGQMDLGGYIDIAKTCEKIGIESLYEGIPARDWPINECRLLAAMTSISDSLLKEMDMQDPLTLEIFEKALNHPHSFTFHLYSSHLDTFVPSSVFEEEVKLLNGKIDYVEFPKSGHDGFFSEIKIWQDLAKP